VLEDTMLLQTKEVTSLQKPAKRDYQSMVRYFRNEEPIPRKEASFIRRKEDIVTLRCGRESAGFDILVERSLIKLDSCLKRINCNLIQVRVAEFLEVGAFC
jgi:hypothetical protein